MTLVTVREHARLTTGPLQAPGIDQATISQVAFDWLCHEAQRYRTGDAVLVQVDDRRWLRLDNYVGVLEAPDGTRIEILPKHTHDASDAGSARKVLYRMLRDCLSLPTKDAGPTSLQTFKTPVSEWIIQQFLAELDALVRKGLRFDYRPVEDELRFLRGRLLVSRQIRQPAGRQHLFQVEHQVFDVNRAENRLIRSALDKVAGMTRDADNWRLARKLEHQLADVEQSTDITGDFRRWSGDRLMQHYGAIRSWCELVLGDQTPLSTVGEWRGRSLLFPMEKVFERFVERSLRKRLPTGARVQPQAASEWLCHTSTRKVFRLRPDFVVQYGGETWVVDAKWKLLDSADLDANYGISQSDLYQLFAYGHRYLGSHGRMALVYPQTTAFCHPLETFHFDDDLSLDVIPLDLGTGCWQGSCLPVMAQSTRGGTTANTDDVAVAV